jgi:tRNA A37 methylthiotransferase MiaB
MLVLLSQVIAAHPNIAKQLHMPAQSGSSSVLQRMRRGYTREAYDALIQRVRALMPEVRACMLLAHAMTSLFLPLRPPAGY